MSTENTGGACLSMGSAHWRRLEARVRCQFPPGQLRRIDVEQAINDALQQWWQIASAEERENAQASVTPLLSSILRRRIWNAIEFEGQAKRDASVCLWAAAVESIPDSSSIFDQIESDDAQQVLSIRLSEREFHMLQLRTQAMPGTRFSSRLELPLLSFESFAEDLRFVRNCCFLGEQNSTRTKTFDKISGILILQGRFAYLPHRGK